MALAVMLLLLVVFQRQAEAYVEADLALRTVRAELHREIDISIQLHRWSARNGAADHRNV